MKNLLKSAMFAGILTGSFVGCGALMSGPSPEAASKVRTIAEKYSQPNRSLGASSLSRTGLSSGQWVALLNTSKTNPDDVSLSVMKIASVRGSTVDMEIETYSSHSDGSRQVLSQSVAHYPTKVRFDMSPESLQRLGKEMRLERVRMMDSSGNVTEVPSFALNIANQGIDQISPLLSTSTPKAGDCGSSFISAAKCYRVEFESEGFMNDTDGVTYAHSAVPILGYLLTETDDSRTEVIGFGRKGAQIFLR